MSKNYEIADIFDVIADALEFKGDNFFKITAYRKAARALREYHGDIEKDIKAGLFPEIEGIGKGLSEKIAEYISTGTIKKYEEMVSDIPEGLLELLNVQNLGPKTLYLLYKELGVKRLEDIEEALDIGLVTKLPGMGAKRAANIKKGLERYKIGRSKIPLGIALRIAAEITAILKRITPDVSIAGSLRRMQETVGDIDILVSAHKREKVIEAFISHPSVKDILLQGETKISVIVEPRNIQIDLRIVEKESYGAALLYFTGSKAHNVKIRGIAKEKGLKINEYGVFKDEKKIAGKTEEEVYKAIGLEWIPPELREERGETENAAKGRLPQLVSLKNIKGDFHVHSNYSDGTDDIRRLAVEARKMGYEYIGICDHSKTSRIARGLDEITLRRRNAEIDAVQKEMPDIKILKGMEVDILSQGQLDYPDIILEQLDYVIVAIHQGFAKNVTQRMKEAIENPFVDMIAHPTGRLLSGREGYQVNLDEIMELAAKKNVALEINASSDRLDLNDVNILRAREFGAVFTIGSDAHNTEMLGEMGLGIGMAKRGWLEDKDVLNTYTWDTIPLRRKKN